MDVHIGKTAEIASRPANNLLRRLSPADYALLSQRYDIVAILPGRWPRHFQDAF